MNKTHTQVLFQLLLHYCIFVNVSFAFWEAGWQRKAVYYLDNLNDFGGKSLVFWFKFSFHYHSSDDRCLMIFILTQMDYYWFPWFGYSATCWWSLVYESQGPFYCSVPFRFLFRFFREGHGDVLSPLFQGGGVTGAKSSDCGRRPGHTLNESPAHCRTLADGSGCHTGANCASGAILGFSILLKDTLACSSVPPQGSRDSNSRPSDVGTGPNIKINWHHSAI